MVNDKESRLARGKDRYGFSEKRESLDVTYAIPPDKAAKALKRNINSMGANRFEWTGATPREKPIERDCFKSIHYRPQERAVTVGDLFWVMREGNFTVARVAEIIGRPKNTVMSWVRNSRHVSPGHVLMLSVEEYKKLYDAAMNRKSRVAR